jgi:endonuclease/exonuclease/phosphatase family metal-dependent hydrolase
VNRGFRTFLLLFVVVAAGGCGETRGPPPLDVHVMSFNIRWEVPGRDGRNAWEHRRAQVVGLLRDPTLDVVGLQEATPAQVADLQAALPAMAFHSDDPVMNGVVVLYREDRFRLEESGAFWFSPTPDVPESRDWHSETRRHVCAWVRLAHRSTGRSFYLYDLHWDGYEPSRRLSAVLLGERIASRKTPDPVIVVGDFNTGENEWASRYLRGEITTEEGEVMSPPLVDTFRVLHPGVTEVGTGNAFRGRTTGHKIDYVYVVEGISVSAAAIDRRHVEGAYPSDHFPVTATVRLEN